MIPAIVLTSSGPHRSLLRLPGDQQSVTSHLQYLLLAWLPHQFIIIILVTEPGTHKLEKKTREAR